MRILLPIARYDYGKPELGDSYEYLAFVAPLRSLGHDVHVVDTLDLAHDRDPRKVASAVLADASDFRPDVVLTMLMEDELPLDVIRRLGESATTINWFADDTWRFFAFSRHLAPAFDWSITTSRKALEAYGRVDGARAIFAPWGFNPDVFHPVETDVVHEVSFIGQVYGVRQRLIDRLRRDGVDVHVRGANTPGGRLAVEDLAAGFASSKINLGFLASSAGPAQRLGLRFRGSYRADQLITRFIRPPLQMKARIVEIPASGAFAIVDHIPELRELFEPGSEIADARSYRELRDAISYYLSHDEERRAIARQGCARAHASHTYQTRFSQIFEQIGLT